MKKFVALMAGLLISTPVHATTLWGGLSEGMSKAEVKALYPKRSTLLMEGCGADISPEYQKGKLTAVGLEYASKSEARCGEIITQTLIEKYGEPLAIETEIERNSCGSTYEGGVSGLLASLCKASGGDAPREIVYRKWEVDGVEVALKRYTDDEKTWWLIYRPVVKGDAELAGKL